MACALTTGAGARAPLHLGPHTTSHHTDVLHARHSYILASLYIIAATSCPPGATSNGRAG